MKRICKKFEECAIVKSDSGCYEGRGNLKDGSGICPEYIPLTKRKESTIYQDELIGGYAIK